ncbi:hypothetical protein [Neobacillus ginsengisoli]|uniref:ABC-type proline/glycine betaine transport system permease subunit n=1 Tax=Neobacillus ginsengisoli TaxID=904295 RepID=A0ABT9XQ18_9BACI|nr:hypothetical protein [Neobacillus ginsengisoli]MDQ0197645.1 ABC-type proline/glycine betaine transport system permease subunit [Neobacillus ginsengisoli]
MMSDDGIFQRAAFVPLLFAPVSLLLALVPRRKQTAFDWAMKVVHAQLMKIGMALLLTILFGIAVILYRATETSDMGFLGMILLQIICFLGIWAKRKELINMVSSATNNIQSSIGATLQSYLQKYQQKSAAVFIFIHCIRNISFQG